MATDRNLPGLLGTAAARVDTVGNQISAMQSQLLFLSVPSLIGWSGTASVKAGKDFRRVQQQLKSQATACHDLADTLRAAAKSASLRIYYEDQARERAEAKAKAAAEAEKKKP